MAPESETTATSNNTIKSKIKTVLRDIIIPTRLSEPTSDIRNVMLVGATLIATVTFQAGITPPGGVWQSDDNLGHKAGHAVYSDEKIPYQIFLLCNSIALTSSIYLLLCLTYKYPYFLEVFIAAMSMMGTYMSSIYCITPYESASFRLLFLTAPAAMAIRVLILVLGCIFRRPSCETEEHN